MAKKEVVKAEYPHFEEKRNVKIWIKKPGKSFQMSVEGIGGRFFGSLTRKMDNSTVADAIGIVTKTAKSDLKAQFKGLDRMAKLNMILSLLK